MTIYEAKKLKWGTVLKPSVAGRRELQEGREGIFLGIDRTGQFIKVVPRGVSTYGTYKPLFWNVKPESKI